jgi:hypothetical protein
MATRKQRAAAQEPEAGPPPYYEATRTIYWYNPEGGSMPLLAHVAGDRVTPEDVEANHWGDLVRVPDAFEGAQPPPGSTTPEQATGPEGTAPELPDTTQALDPAADDNPESAPAETAELPDEGGKE